MRQYDLVVIGGGIAGLTAGLFGARYGLKTIILEEMMTGGQIINAQKIENFPGFPEGISGGQLGSLLQQQAMNSGCTLELVGVTGLMAQNPYLTIDTTGGAVRGKAVVVAAGSTLRPLGIPGEEKYKGRGVSHCATCDGPFFVGGVVCVVGGGDSAADEALTLTEYASRVILFHRGEKLHAQKILQDRIRANPKIQMRFGTEVTEALGKETGLSGVRIRDTATGETSEEEEVSGLFIYVGLEPNSAFLKGVVELDNAGHVVTDIWMRTKVPGLYAVGDIRQHSAAQIITGAGDGATAAIHASGYIATRAWQ